MMGYGFYLHIQKELGFCKFLFNKNVLPIINIYCLGQTNQIVETYWAKVLVGFNFISLKTTKQTNKNTKTQTVAIECWFELNSICFNKSVVAWVHIYLF